MQARSPVAEFDDEMGRNIARSNRAEGALTEPETSRLLVV